LVLKPQFFKFLRPSKIKTKTKSALAKTKTSKYGLKTKTGLKNYITGTNYTQLHQLAGLGKLCKLLQRSQSETEPVRFWCGR